MATVHGSCLCGDVAWEADGPFELMSHCHCARCRKSHGAAFGTYLTCPEAAFRPGRGRDRIVRWESSPGAFRPFCGRCGTVVPDGVAWQGRVAMPAGPLDDDPGVRPLAHIFVASRAPWFALHDDLPRFDAYPPGFDVPVLADLPDRQPAGDGLRGSCLCGGVTFRVAGTPRGAMHCHCTRCRKARAAAHASNLFTAAADVVFTRGTELLASHRVPDARFFAQVFCRTCGSPMPRIDRDRDMAVVPMGSLDDDPGIRPAAHIWAGSMAPWYVIADDLPRYAQGPTR